MVNPIDIPGASIDEAEELMFSISIGNEAPTTQVGRVDYHPPTTEDALSEHPSSPEVKPPTATSPVRSYPSFSSTSSPEPAHVLQIHSSPSSEPAGFPETRTHLQAGSQPPALPQPNLVPAQGFACWIMNPAGTFRHGHEDLVQSIHYNFYGDRLVTGSSDHRIKVWNRKPDGEFELVDTWRGHDAEVMEVKWTGPHMGPHLVSIGEDNKFKVWEENPTEAPNSGRRFKCIYSQQTKFRVPYKSVDVKSYRFETYVALISRDGYLTLMEPTNQDSLGNWKEIDQFFVCTPPDRGEEAGFKLSFHQDPLPCFNAIAAGLDSNALSLAVAAMDVVQVYRAIREPGKDYQLHLAAQLTGHNDIIRDVSWADGSIRGHDTIASGCKDGFIRIFEISTPTTYHQNPAPSQDQAAQPAGASSSTNDASSSSTGARNATSGIGAVLAGASRTDGAMHRREEYKCSVKHTWKEVAAINAHGGAVWTVKFCRRPGDMLASIGDDAVTRFWKCAITGEWMECAEMVVGDEKEVADEEEDDDDEDEQEA